MLRKAGILIMAIMLLGLVLGGCSRAASRPSVSMHDLQTAMLAADSSLPEMTAVNDASENAKNLFSYLSDLDYDKVAGFFLAYSAQGRADEVAVIETRDVKDVASAVDTLKKHRENRVKLYQSYQPDQVARAQNALIFDRGNYAVLIISDNQDSIRAAFEKAVGN